MNGLTPINSLGEHVISDVDSLGDDLWRVNVNGSSQTGTFTDASTVKYHAFTVEQNKTLTITASIPDLTTYTHLHLFHDDGDLTVDDYIYQTNAGVGRKAVMTRQLSAGNYIVALSSWHLTQNEAVAGSNDQVATGAYSIEVYDASPWQSNTLTNARVVLDITDGLAPDYEIISNTSRSMIVKSPDDLTNIIGQTLVGLHRFETISITGGAHVDFGDDRVVVNDLSGSVIDAQSGIKLSPSSTELIDYFMLTANGNVAVNNSLPLNISNVALLSQDEQQDSDTIAVASYVDNNMIAGDFNTTPARSVGEYLITGAKIIEDTNKWIITNKERALSVQGIKTTDDLTVFIDKNLVGVHSFETITITGDAYVDFGTGHVIILNPSMSLIDGNSNIRAGSITEGIPIATNINGFYSPFENNHSNIKANISLIAAQWHRREKTLPFKGQLSAQIFNKKVA
jgi:hypothetical protein